MITLLIVVTIFLVGALAYGYYRGYMDAYDKGMDDCTKIAKKQMRQLNEDLRDYYEEQIKQLKQKS